MTLLARAALIVAALGLMWTVVAERRSGRVPALSLPRRWFPRGRASVSVFIVVVVAGLAMVLLPGLLERAPRIAPGPLPRTTTFWALVAATVTAKALLVLAEEIVFRGAVLDLARRALGSGTAILASAVLFGLAHASRASDPSHLAAVAGTAIDGVGYAAATVLTGSLWPAVAWHLAKNLAVWQFVGSSTLEFVPGSLCCAAPTTWRADLLAALVVVATAMVAIRAVRRPARPGIVSRQ